MSRDSCSTSRPVLAVRLSGRLPHVRRPRLKRLRDYLRAMPLMVRLGPTGWRVVTILVSRLANEVDESIAAWDPRDPDSSLRIGNAARRLAALVRRELSDEGTKPVRWDLHAEMDAFLLNLEDLDQAMRAAAVDREDGGVVLKAAMAATSHLGDRGRLVTLILARTRHLPSEPDDGR